MTLIAFAAGLIIGWQFPQPAFVKTLLGWAKDKITSYIK